MLDGGGGSPKGGAAFGLAPGEVPTPRETALIAELAALGATVARAKAEIAALRVQDVDPQPFPAATDELDAVVAHTAAATDTILDCCEALEALEPGVDAAAAAVLRDVTTRIYEACSFQDITGQRIAKVVAALQAIEARVAAVANTMEGGGAAEEPSDAGLLNGPQLPGRAMEQASIDQLLASFD